MEIFLEQVISEVYFRVYQMENRRRALCANEDHGDIKQLELFEITIIEE